MIIIALLSRIFDNVQTSHVYLCDVKMISFDVVHISKPYLSSVVCSDNTTACCLGKGKEYLLIITDVKRHVLVPLKYFDSYNTSAFIEI